VKTVELVLSQDVPALRGAIHELLQDPARRAAMAANCRRIAVEEYALEVQARRYVELYEEILAGVGHESLSHEGG
jgi:glycosyltransferase involved in cell wall biosynthesis